MYHDVEMSSGWSGESEFSEVKGKILSISRIIEVAKDYPCITYLSTLRPYK